MMLLLSHGLRNGCLYRSKNYVCTGRGIELIAFLIQAVLCGLQGVVGMGV